MFSDTERGTEQWKAWLDYLKHTTTIAIAISILIVAFFKDLTVVTDKVFLILAIASFLISAACSMISHNIFIATYEGNNKLNTALLKYAGISLFISWASFILGMVVIVGFMIVSAWVA